MSRFFDLPNRGGWLTIINALFWLTLFLELLPLPKGGVVMLLCLVFFSLPLTPILVSCFHTHPRTSETITLFILLGLNSFLWGYGLSYLLYRLRRTNFKYLLFPDLAPIDQPPPPPDPKCLTCGYDLRATPTRCPECGTEPAHGP